MKGITHFMTGIALATCFPQVVALARAGALLPVLGGVGGLLPDVLDFRFARYWERYDVEIDPAPFTVSGKGSGGQLSGRAGAAFVVDALADALQRAYVTGKPCSVAAHTLRLGHDLWRRYTIHLVPDASAIAVCFGPLVTTSGVSYPGTELPDSVWVERDLDIPFVHSYSHEYHVDAFTGPSFRFTRERAAPGHPQGAGEVVVISFLDWHHRWTHSLPLACAVGLITGGLAALAWGTQVGFWAGALTATGFAAHVLEDQLGHMGSNLFWPFTRRRHTGAKLVHAGEAIPNFLITWTALALTLFNLDRLGGSGALPASLYLFLTLVLPWLVLGTLHLVQRRRNAASLLLSDDSLSAEAERRAEIGEFGEG